MSHHTYDEAVWETDELDASFEGLTLTDVPGLDQSPQSQPPKFETMRVSFSAKYQIGHLGDKRQIEFSMANRALTEDDFEFSNRSDFENPDNKYVVEEVTVERLDATNLKTPSLYLEFPTVTAPGRHKLGNFAALADTGTSAATRRVPANAVRINVKPNTGTMARFNAKLNPDAIEHAQIHPDLSRETLRNTYGEIRGKNGTFYWVSVDSPLLHLLGEGRKELLTYDTKFGCYTYGGHKDDLFDAEQTLLAVDEQNVQYSDLRPENFAFVLSVPAERVHDPVTDKFDMARPDFRQLVAGPAVSYATSSRLPRGAQEAVAKFDSKYVTFSGLISIKYAKIPPRRQQ